MSQSTKPIPQGRVTAMVDQFAHGIGATALPQGTLCMTDAAGLAIPFLDTTLEGGTGAMLGYASCDMDASDARATPRAFLFHRGCRWLAPAAKAGDVPTAVELGKKISVQDNQTVKKTIAGGGLEVILLDIRSDGYLVQLP